jgi:hypothetical protein
MSVTNAAYYNVFSVTCFIDEKYIRPAEMHHQLFEVYGESITSEGNVPKWCRLFNEGKENVNSDVISGHPFMITAKLKDSVDTHAR